jgi:hypothetical protein
MRTSWIIRSAAIVAAGFAVLLGGARPSLANAVIVLSPGSANQTATYFPKQCGDYGDGPLANQDIWVFLLAHPSGQGTFVSVTATFSNPAATVTIPADGGGIDNGGTSIAWIAYPAGATLTNASAVITGEINGPDDAFFNVTHTCPASGTPSPSSSLSPSAVSPTPNTRQLPSGIPPQPPSASSSTSESVGFTLTEFASPTPAESTGLAPVPGGSVDTGEGGSDVSLSSIFLGGGALLGAVAGIGFLLLARQRRDLA